MAEGLLRYTDIKTFKAIEILGLDWSKNPTTTQIYTAMPNRSIFIFQTTAATGGEGNSIYQELGNQSGAVMIVRINSYRGFGIFVKYDTNTGKNYVVSILKVCGENTVEWSPKIDLSDTGWLVYENSNVFNGQILYRKVNNEVDVCFFGISLKNDFTVGSGNLELGTLPSGYRPEAYPSSVSSSGHYITFPIRIYDSATNNNFSYSGTIFDWGLIRIYADKNALSKILTSATLSGSAHYHV